MEAWSNLKNTIYIFNYNYIEKKLDSIYIFNLLYTVLGCLNWWSDDCYLPNFGNSISGCDICFELMKFFLIIEEE